MLARFVGAIGHPLAGAEPQLAEDGVVG
jgi:hypothetical protein